MAWVAFVFLIRRMTALTGWGRLSGGTAGAVCRYAATFCACLRRAASSPAPARSAGASLPSRRQLSAGDRPASARRRNTSTSSPAPARSAGASLPSRRQLSAGDRPASARRRNTSTSSPAPARSAGASLPSRRQLSAGDRPASARRRNTSASRPEPAAPPTGSPFPATPGHRLNPRPVLSPLIGSRSRNAGTDESKPVTAGPASSRSARSRLATARPMSPPSDRCCSARAPPDIPTDTPLCSG